MSVEEDFWKWFVEHEVMLIDFEIDRDGIFDKLSKALGKVDPNLTFEFGPSDAKRELVISAAGIKSAFPSVVSLVNAAPPLERWNLIAFRPRRSPINRIEIGRVQVDPDDVQCTLLDNGEMAGIYLFIPGFSEDNIALKQIAYLLLDEALGEYDVEMRLGLIQMLPPEARKDGERLPLSDLPFHFDRLVSRLEWRLGLPS